MEYNAKKGIVPQALNKKVGELLDVGQGTNYKAKNKQRLQKSGKTDRTLSTENAKEYLTMKLKIGATNVQHTKIESLKKQLASGDYCCMN